MFLEEVREKLLSEAKNSPNLLSDLAGLEMYIAESYHNRSFIELLQNADDASATKFKVIKNGEFLFVANNGRNFDKKDLEGLCRSAASNKVKGEKIGYRGIGFKSVVGYSLEIHIISGKMELTFSRYRTSLDIPEATRVPLIRIPHKLNDKDRTQIAPVIKTLQSEGHTTVFVFTGINSELLKAEFELFPFRSLIFLNSVIEAEVIGEHNFKTTVSKNRISEYEYLLSLTSNNEISRWFRSSYQSSSLAFCVENDNVDKLSEEDALIYAFLPTDELSGLGVLVNGNFSTDPSRRHLIYDNETDKAIKLCSEHINLLLTSKISSKSGVGIINALVPYNDPRMVHYLKKSFVSYLLQHLKQQETNIFKSLLLSPSWLNVKDFMEFAKILKVKTIENNIYDKSGFVSFAKYMGAKELSFLDFAEIINDVEISSIGCAQITNYLFTSALTQNNENENNIVNTKMLLCQNERKSLKELNSNKFKIDESFLSLIYSNGLTESDVKQVLKKFAPDFLIESHFKNEHNKPIITDQAIETGDKLTLQDVSVIEASKNIQRWRSAEEKCLYLLNTIGYKLEDVSKQNIGYDLDGFDPNNNRIQIEVKSILFPGQKFKLTNNEIALASEKQKSYHIAIVRQSEKNIEIALISDPANTLNLNRQCVQWIWECESYEYRPMKFPI